MSPGPFSTADLRSLRWDSTTIVFREEIVKAIRDGKYPLHKEIPQEKLEQHLNEKWLCDDILLKVVLHEILSSSERRRFFFVITATSHIPFPTDHLDKKDKLIPNETMIQHNFLNSIHAVDGWLREFYDGLPQGTLLVIYGDHTPVFRSGPFVSDIEKHREFVPCFIHVVGENLAAFQKTPRRPPQKNMLSVRDVHSFLRDVTENNTNKTDGLKEAKAGSLKTF